MKIYLSRHFLLLLLTIANSEPFACALNLRDLVACQTDQGHLTNHNRYNLSGETIEQRTNGKRSSELRRTKN